MKNFWGMVLIFGLVFIGLFLFFRFGLGGKEDVWICDNGSWVKHGNPSEPMPLVPCERQGQTSEQIEPTEGFKKVSYEESQKIAEEFAKNTPTYKFDGMDLKFESSEAFKCPYCWQFVFFFNSRHAGWGDRKGMILAQVITPHKLAINVQEGKVIVAVTDQTYDEMNLRYIK